LTFPWQLHIGVAGIPYHVIFETAGIFIGFRYFLYLRRKHDDAIVTTNRLWIIIGAIFGAVIGSRLLGGLENPRRMFEASSVFLHFYQNTTIVGGLLGGLTGVELAKKLIGEKKSSGDLFTYPLILAMMIGRIGCFSMGVYEDTFGAETSSVFGMNLGDGLIRHPVALYEIIYLIMSWLFIGTTASKYDLAEGGKFKIFMILYLIFRLLLDYIKPHYTFSFGLSSIQIACIAGLIYYSYFIINPRKIFATYA
jgi:phosphatidylglycerol---prolipoprotein diacylglyceryl transferase